MHGARHAAGELGHTLMIEEGPARKGGIFGCQEATAGAAGIETKIRKAIADGGGSEVMALAHGNPANVSGWMILNAAKAGDKACAAIVEQATHNLGLWPRQHGQSLQSRLLIRRFNSRDRVCSTR